MTAKEYRQERISRGLTQAQMAELLGIHTVTQNRRETGRIPIITEETARAVRSLPPRRPESVAAEMASDIVRDFKKKAKHLMRKASGKALSTNQVKKQKKLVETK